MSRSVAVGLRITVAILAVLGVVSAILRALVLSDEAIARAVSARQQHIVEQLRADDPITERWRRETEAIDRRFTQARAAMLLHVGAGGLFLALAPLQFIGAIRRRFIRFHRWSGRVLVGAAFASTLPGFYFGIVIPYGGAGEASAIAAFGAVFVIAILCGVVAIRRGDRVRHREWMIRAFAAAIAISTVRVIGLVALAFTDRPLRDQLGPLFWTGWTITLIAAELWIRYTRPRSVAVAADLARV